MVPILYSVVSSCISYFAFLQEFDDEALLEEATSRSLHLSPLAEVQFLLRLPSQGIRVTRAPVVHAKQQNVDDQIEPSTHMLEEAAARHLVVSFHSQMTARCRQRRKPERISTINDNLENLDFL